jgi:hypothetical protein
VVFGGANANPQETRHLFVAVSFCEQLHDLKLSAGQQKVPVPAIDVPPANRWRI